MRLNVAFVVLLFLAATATSVAWRATDVALAGDATAWVGVAIATPVGLAALALLIRIVGRVTRARSAAGRERRA